MRSGAPSYRRLSVYRRLCWRLADHEISPGSTPDGREPHICVLSLTNEGESAESCLYLEAPLRVGLSLQGEAMRIEAVSCIEGRSRRSFPYMPLPDGAIALEPSIGEVSAEVNLLNPADEVVVAVLASREYLRRGSRSGAAGGRAIRRRPGVVVGGGPEGRGVAVAGRERLSTAMLTRLTDSHYLEEARGLFREMTES